MRSELLNGGAYCRTAFAAIAKTATAGGAGDDTEVNTAWVDRMDDDYGMAMSAKLVIVYEAALADTETLTFAGNFQDASDAAGSDAADYGTAIAATTVSSADSAGSTNDGTIEIDVDLSAAKEFVRFQLTPNLSAGATDTLKWSATLVFFGGSRQPSSKAIASVGGPTI